MKCALCKLALDQESPYVVYALNPSSFRMAWMHDYCYQVAYEDLQDEDARDPQFLNRKDEYDQRIA